ncbi:hypothetical protein [Pedobacter foliorum]|uniref:hypothetical protein n=1 Tax=Pedobacter foliorum TaxID=2739058 RepID=UPI001563D7E5|nr:hypothetical protein [Pedobacter foliorum]NRF37589.1 hypothetical protein [Pedobacter foliorum]
MKNELSLLGQLIFDLSKVNNLDSVPESNFLLIGSEYPRISSALTNLREKRRLGWVYQLDFHAAETGRLLQKLRIDRVYHELLQVYDCRLDELRRTYDMLEEVLSELAEGIELLRFKENGHPEELKLN